MNIENIRTIVASRIRRLRISKGWTQERLAEEIDIHPTYLSRLESGKKLPTLSLICKISDIFELDAYELLMDDIKLNSSNHKKRKLLYILNEAKPEYLEIYSTVVYALHRQYKKSKSH